MKINVNEVVAAGRSQAWFDSLTPAQQKEYLKKKPNSRFAKRAKSESDKTAKPASKKTPSKKPSGATSKDKLEKERAALLRKLEDADADLESLREDLEDEFYDSQDVESDVKQDPSYKAAARKVANLEKQLDAIDAKLGKSKT